MDISQYLSINSVSISNNQLTSLNLSSGNNSNFQGVNIVGNPNLTCIKVDNVSFSNTNWTLIDAQHTFNTDCSPTSLGMVTNTMSFSIYPNPASSQLIIQTEGVIDTVEIYSLTGQLTASFNSDSIDISGLAVGVYIIRVKVDGYTGVQRLAKQ